MAKINIMLMAFILIGWTVFKSLFLPGGVAAEISENFISIGVNCQDEDGNYTLFQNDTVCLNPNELVNFEAPCTFVETDGWDAISEATQNIACAIQVGFVFLFVIIKLLVAIILAFFILIINIVLLVALYLAIGLTPIPGAPTVINAILIGPFILGNFALVVSFFTGD